MACESKEEINYLYKKLSANGKVLMELNRYPFAEKYAWINDRYGISWQLILASSAQKITPMFLFTGAHLGQAQEAIHFYVDMFKHRGEETGISEGGVFNIAGQEFMAIDSPEPHNFNFTPAISFVIECKNQEEIDYFWEKFRLAGKPGQCGWVEDKFGISWQIVPVVLSELLADKDPRTSERVTRAMLQMTKLDIEALKKAYANVI